MIEKPTKNFDAAPNFTFYPLAWLSVCYAFGILFEQYFQIFAGKTYLFFCLLSAVLATIFIKIKTASAVFLLFSFMALGAFCLNAENSSVAPNRLKILYDQGVLNSGEPVKVTGVLRGKAESAVGGFFIELKTESVIYKDEEKSVSGNVRLFAPTGNKQIADEYEQIQLKYGTRIRIACPLKREEKFQNPGVASRREILDRKETDATGLIKSPLFIENLGESGSGFRSLAWIFERRQDLIEDFRTHFSVQTAGVLIASLLGNRFYLDKSTSEKFREGGTFHVLVISGLQITFIGMLSVLFIRLFTRSRLLQFILASIFLWSYSLAVGADAPVLRAVVMFTILLFANVIFRQATLLNSLGASALILLVWRPSDLFDQSFQLTFACVTAIVATAFPLLEKIRAVGEWRLSAETPIPPTNCPKKFRAFCEALYWSEEAWQAEQARSIWSCRVFKTPVAEMLERVKVQKILRYVFETLLVSVIVQSWLVPLLVVYFHRLSLVGIFLNIWVGLLMAIESIVAILAIFAAQVSTALAAPLILITEILNWFVLHGADMFIENGWASIRLPHYSGSLQVIYVLYFAPVISLTYLLQKWKPLAFDFKFLKSKLQLRISFAAFAIFLLLIIFHPLSAPRADGRLHVDFLDVGQGDAALLTMPTGETLLVDGGGKVNFNSLYVGREGEKPEIFEPDAQEIGEAVVSEFLWEKGYSQIDYILATHADADHIQGLSAVARNFRVRTAIFGRTPENDNDFIELSEVLRKRKIPIYVASRGEILNFGEVFIEILYPEKDETSGAASDNNHSVVLRVIYGERKFLLTGDIEKETEKELVADSPEILQADVVKVAHHGSRTSSTENFINLSKAKVAVISVGRESPFGHPKPEVVERWKKSGAKVLTTGDNGAISFSTNGKDLQMKTFLKNVTYR